MLRRHLEPPRDGDSERLSLAAIDDLLERGDLHDWADLAARVADDPWGPLADAVLRICEAHRMYGTSELWRLWIERVRKKSSEVTPGGRTKVAGSRPVPLAKLRRLRKLPQSALGQRLGISQSDVSKLEHRGDVRVKTLRTYVQAMGGRLRLLASFPDSEDIEIELPIGPLEGGRRLGQTIEGPASD